MENDYGTPPAKELVGGHQSPSKTPRTQQEMTTPSVLVEQHNNIMKPIKDKEEEGEGGVEGGVEAGVEEGGGKRGSHPDPLKVSLHHRHQHQQKLWAFPGRYMSPTDRIVSPVSQTLLARNKKAPLPPSLMYSPPPKAQDGTNKDFGPSAP